jgi:LCP family protein required for cell wall assembly
LGIDYTDPGNALARSETIILATFNPKPVRPYVRMLSIPRDLWVTIPGLGENRINTAHYYAEGNLPGSGPQALLQTIAKNFGVEIPYYLRIRFEGFRDLVNALGGVDIVLAKPAAGYPAGKHHLKGRKALAFVRNRTDADDFFRMENSQLMMRALLKNMLNPFKWPRLPAVAKAFFAAIDTNAPIWVWPRLAAALLRVGPGGIQSHIIPRQMTTPYTTDQGAQVLIPNWPLIHLLTQQLFGN